MIIDQWRVELATLQPVSVSAPERSSTKASADLPVAADPWGEPQVPSSGLAGSLRTHATRVLGRPACEALLGAELALGSGNGPQAVLPSAIRFLGTTLMMPGAVTVLEQTSVSRWSGAAADRSLRAREALPIGSRVNLYLTAEDLAGPALADFRKALSTWRPVIGGASTTGLGDAELKSIHYRRLDLAKEADLATWLASGGPDTWSGTHKGGWQTWEVGAGEDRDDEVTWRFSIRGDLRIGIGKPAPGEAASSLRRGTDYVIPGSAWKGVFRARAEFILRTCGLPTCNSTDEGCCTKPECITCTLFGWSGRSRATSAVGARGPLRFHTSSVIAAETTTRKHVSIDRFTGGARRGQLFSELVLCAGEATLVVDIPESVRGWAAPLLDWVALDIHDGFVGIGHGTARGMGSLLLVDPVPIRARARDLIKTIPVLGEGAASHA